MKILVLNPILFSGEKNKLPQVDSIKDTMIYSMCMAFVDLGHQVTLLAIDDYQPQQQKHYDFEILFFKNNLKRTLPAALPCSWQMRQYIQKNSEKFDMILSSEVFGFHSLFAARIAPEKTLIWHELVAHQRKGKTVPSRIWHSVVVPLFFRNVKVVVGRSEPAIRFISQYMKQVDVDFVDHGIDVSKFQIAASKKRQFISIAQLVPRKQVGSIITIFGEFIKNPKYADFQLLIAGRGELEEKLRAQVKELHLEENVVFCGFLSHEELSKHLSESYASLIHTNNDLNMVSIPEAIVSGTPIVSNTVPALSGFIIKNKLGIIKDHWGVAELTEIVENPVYSQNCISIRETMSSKSAAQRLIDIFKKGN